MSITSIVSKAQVFIYNVCKALTQSSYKTVYISGGYDKVAVISLQDTYGFPLQ
jgi:hypothetical protein